jgi:phosphatidylglycerophosphate synthase
MLDAIADKVLVNPILILLSANGFIPVIIPVIYITRDIVVDAIKMQAASKGKVEHLVGLEENIIIGKLIPAGTGAKEYKNLLPQPASANPDGEQNLLGDVY